MRPAMSSMTSVQALLMNTSAQDCHMRSHTSTESLLHFQRVMVGNVLRVIVPCILLVGPSVSLSGQEAAPAVRMVADEGEGAKFWPRWRGPSGQGLVSGAGYPDAWSPTQNVRWKTPLSGDGNSSPWCGAIASS